MASSFEEDSTLRSLMERFARADACWFSSVRSDGRAHMAPLWHVWHAQCVYVVTPSTSVKARNIRHHPKVSLALPDAMNVLIVEGLAQPAPELGEVLQPLFQTKYNWDMLGDAAYDTIIQVTPTRIIAWGEHGTGKWSFQHA